jgi:hypothetical protein
MVVSSSYFEVTFVCDSLFESLVSVLYLLIFIYSHCICEKNFVGDLRKSLRESLRE